MRAAEFRTPRAVLKESSSTATASRHSRRGALLSPARPVLQFPWRCSCNGSAVPFYGAQPAAADAAKIKAPLLIHYAGNDERINAGWPAYEAALKAAGVKYEAFVDAGTEHGFNNDTTPRYDAAAANFAWSRTVDFFNKNLRG